MLHNYEQQHVLPRITSINTTKGWISRMNCVDVKTFLLNVIQKTLLKQHKKLTMFILRINPEEFLS